MEKVAYFDSSAAEAERSLKYCMWPAFTLSSMFMALILWDMASDEISFANSVAIPIIMLVTPTFLWLSTSKKAFLQLRVFTGFSTDAPAGVAGAGSVENPML
jgi:hypothetical protein